MAISDPGRSIARYYVDNDVYEAARALTVGATTPEPEQQHVCGSGQFFAQQMHTTSRKIGVGPRIRDDALESRRRYEGTTVLKIAAYHPGTAINIARKLCQRLVADTPPQEPGQAAAATFLEHRLAPDQIERDAAHDPELCRVQGSALGAASQGPFEYVCRRCAAAGSTTLVREDDTSNTTDEFIYYYGFAGQACYTGARPGYPTPRPLARYHGLGAGMAHVRLARSIATRTTPPRA